jgi:enoyl-CoA hydratase/carnithine racemase
VSAKGPAPPEREAAAAPVRLERDGPLAVIVLDSPPLNLFSQDLFRALVGRIDEVADSDARALLYRAEGELFTGGADVNDFNRVVEQGGADESFGSLLVAAHKLEALEIPTLALVHGLCLTAGLETSLACDMLWASTSARFGLVEAVVGLTPGAGGTQRMAERAGPARAAEFVMSSGIYDAETLERWNVVNRVVADDELLEKGLRFAQRLANGPTIAHAATKRIIRAFRAGGVDAADRITEGQFAELFASEDLKGAVKSFLSEGPGKATFEGR